MWTPSTRQAQGGTLGCYRVPERDGEGEGRAGVGGDRGEGHGLNTGTNSSCWAIARGVLVRFSLKGTLEEW